MYVLTAARPVSPTGALTVSLQGEAAALSHYTNKEQEQRDISSKSIL